MKFSSCKGGGTFSILRQHIGFLVGTGFLSAFLGTLVWVNCRGAWFVMRFAKLPDFAPSLSLAYSMWVLVYGCLGGLLFLNFQMVRRWGGCVVLDGALLLGTYFLCLLWQPFFYSAHFLLLSFLTLLGAAGGMAVFLVRILRRSLFLFFCGLFCLAVQVFFLSVTVCCF